MKEMVAHLDRQAGGPGRGWMQITTTPAEARAIIQANKLAVVLGVEVDSLGNWRRMEDLRELSGDDLGRARDLIAAELDWLSSLGVRQITPIHLTGNALGGTAIYMRLLDLLNVFVTGRHYDVVDGWNSGVRYRLDYAGDDVVDSAERAVVAQGDSLTPAGRRTKRQTWLHQIPVFRDLAERHAYPVVLTHAWYRDLAFSAGVEFDRQDPGQYATDDVHKVAHEAAKRADQVERIGRLGGCARRC